MSDIDQLPTQAEMERAEQIHRVLMEAGQRDEPAEVEIHEDRTRETRTPGFTRMVTDWNGPDRTTVQQVIGVVNRQIMQDFADAFEVMNEIYLVARMPVLEGDVIQVDEYGQPLWERTPSGNFVEDWSKFGHKLREHYIFLISTRLFEWEQRSQDGWGEAMLAKAQWEEAFSIGFDEPEGRLTVDDRTHKGRLNARQERYLAIVKSLYSRKAEALVKAMVLLDQRLKDTTP
jgi:hypothetical protein